MKTILVATDFSPAALNAALYATGIARQTNAGILLLNIYQVPLLYAEVPVPVDQQVLEDEIAASMAASRQQLLQHTGNKVPVTTKVVMGVFLDKLQEICAQEKPYLVVLGSQGTTAAERFFLGQHAVQAMKHLQWPVLTVPPQVKYSGIARLGLACDFEKVPETVPVGSLMTFVKDLKAELHILNTGKQEEFEPEVVFGSGMLQEMIKGIKPVYHFVTNKDSVEGIMALAKANDIDLLVVLPKAHSIIEIITHKSITKRLVLSAYLPVMALHVS